MSRKFVNRLAGRGIALGLASITVAFTVVGTPSADAQAKGEERLEDFFQFNAASLRSLQQRQEESVQRCMRSQGFTYQVQAAQTLGLADAPRDDKKKFAEQFGYGISTLFDPDELAKPPKDPNAARLAKMSDAERKAWNRALYGADEPTDANPFSPTAKGCIAASTRELFGAFTQLTIVFSEYEEIQKRVNNDKTVVTAMKAWSGCLKQGGYSFADDTKAQDAINAEFTKLLSAGGNGPGAGGGLASIGSGIDVTALRALQKKEIAQAKVDYACTVKHLQARDKLLIAEEAKLIEKNRPILEDARDLLAGKAPKPTTTTRRTAATSPATTRLRASPTPTTKKPTRPSTTSSAR
jgi:hypothetical protein